FTLVVRVGTSVPAGSTITNTATVSGDLTPDNNSDTENTLVVTQADLEVSKVDSADPVNAGFNLKYTITITNNGPSDAQSVVLSDGTPTNTTFGAAMQPAGPAFPLITPSMGGTGNVSATFAGGFAAGATATFEVTVNVNSSTASGTMISNTATVSSTTSDPTVSNNSVNEMTKVATPAFSVTKMDPPDPVVAGTDLTYTITVNNAGPDAGPSELNDAIPANTTFVSFTAPAGWVGRGP